MKKNFTERWAGRTVMITGGSSGLGRAIAGELASLGARVAIIGRDPERLSQTVLSLAPTGARLLPLICDVSDVDAVAETVRTIEGTLGAIDLLVNNAGEGGPVETVWRTDPRAWWKTFESNLLGSFLCANAVLPSMTERGGGMIVNVASHAGIYRWPTCSAYSVSKCALIKFTENLAAETRRHDIRVFAFHPGLLPIGLGEASRHSGLDPESPRGRIAGWLRTEAAAGRLVDVRRSLDAFIALISGPYGALSGRYVTVADDPDEMLRRVTMEGGQDDWYLLRLSTPADQISITRSDPE